MDDFDRLFDSFRRFAFRFEGLPEYRVAGSDWDDYQSFLSGHPLSPSCNESWAADLRRWTAANKVLERTRLVPLKLTSYMVYELEWCYPYSLAAGEQIRFALESPSTPSELSHVSDFWLFDDSDVMVMEYGADGSYLGETLVTEASSVARYSAIARDLRRSSVDALTFYQQYRADHLQMSLSPMSGEGLR